MGVWEEGEEVGAGTRRNLARNAYEIAYDALLLRLRGLHLFLLSSS